MNTIKKKIVWMLLLISISVGWMYGANLKGSHKTDRNQIRSEKENLFDRLQYEGYMTMQEVGNPELPIRYETYVVPLTAQVTGVNVTKLKKEKVIGSYYLNPVQPPIPTGNSLSFSHAEPNKQVYESANAFPGKQVEIVSDRLEQGYHLVTVRLYPFEYIPVNKEVYSCDFDYTIEFTDNVVDVARSQTQSSYRADLCKLFIKGNVVNPSDVDLFGSATMSVVDNGKSNRKNSKQNRVKTSVLEEHIPDYIIITNDALKPAFQVLADWKTKKGVFTIIKTKEEIAANYDGVDECERIRNYVVAATIKWGAGLFILIGGDVNIIPTKMRLSDYYANQYFPADIYYTTSDLAMTSTTAILGRLPVENTTEAFNLVNKIISYEKASGVTNLNYFKNSMFAAAYLTNGSKLQASYASDVKVYATTLVSSNINKKFLFDNYDGSNTTRYTCPTSGCVLGDMELKHDNFLSMLNNGGFGIGKFHFFYSHDHGSSQNIGTSSIDKNESIQKKEMAALQNGPYYQIMLNGQCNTADFSTDCVAESYLTNPDGGGVAWIGNTDVGWYGEYDQLSNFCKAIYVTPGNVSLGRYDIGAAYRNVLTHNYYSDWRLHLLGDPQMQIWTDAPQTLTLTGVPSALTIGTQTLTIAIPNLPTGVKATVCLWKGTEVYEVRNDILTTGNVSIPFTADTPGDLLVTITAHNFLPKEITIPINQTTAPSLYISDVAFNDTDLTKGNADGKNNAGETIQLNLQVKNSGVNTASGVTGTLSCNSPYITINSNSATYGNLASGITVTSSFSYTIIKDAPQILKNDNSPVIFTLTLKEANNVTYTDKFNIDILTDQVELGDKAILTTTNGDLTISASETVTLNINLSNISDGQGTGLKAVLSRDATLDVNGYIASCSSVQRDYPAIEKNEIKCSTTAFQFGVSVSAGYQTGNPLYFNLVVTNRYGKTWNYSFNLLDKPSGTLVLKEPIANSTSIELNVSNPIPDIKGYNFYRSNTANGSYAKLNHQPVASDKYIDENLPVSTIYYYKVSAVALNGNEGALSSPQKAWTSLATKGLYPIAFDGTVAKGVIRCTVNAADVNNDGLKDIFTATYDDTNPYNGTIMGFNAGGQELYNIDNNVTTVSGFAKIIGAGIQSTPAIGDLKHDGDFRVVTMTRNETGSGSNYYTCHSVNDVNGDMRPDQKWQQALPLSTLSWRGPIISNLDNSEDGKQETVCYSENGEVKVYDDAGNQLYAFASGFGRSYGAPAVGDLDGNGTKEIVMGLTLNLFDSPTGASSIYVWNYDGSLKTQISYSGGYFNNSILLCDIDKDGKNEIVTSVTPQSNVYSRIIVVYKLNPDLTTYSLYSGWTSAAQSIAFTNNYLSCEIAVGDVDNDGNLEIVANGMNAIKIWKKDGTQLINPITLDNSSMSKVAPLIADVDGDGVKDIILGSGSSNKIYGYKSNGDAIVGFPLRTENGSFFEESPCITDVDNDGKSDIIAAVSSPSGGKIYMWETSGNPDNIEWGSERHNCRNTGEYKKTSPTAITSNTTWSMNNDICCNYSVESGATLTITSQINITELTKITVKSGGSLIIDGGKLLDANIEVQSGGNLTIQNNGEIRLHRYGTLQVNSGGTFSQPYGNVEISQ